MNKYLTFFTFVFIYLYYLSSKDYQYSCIIIFLIILFKVIVNYGKSVNLLNLIQLHSCIVYLVAPTIGYLFYGIENEISNIWKAFMPISSADYFKFMIPALIAFYTGMDSLYSAKLDKEISVEIGKVHTALVSKKDVALQLVLIGFISYYLALVVPVFLTFVFNILFSLIFPGLFYLVFSRNKNKFDITIICFILGWVVLAAIKSTMFTIVMYMGVTVSGVLLYNLSLSFFQKLVISLIAFWGILTVQYTKLELRHFRENEKSDISITKFFTTFIKNTSILKGNIDPNLFFPIYIRINQGRLTANVLKNIPSHKDYDNGDRLFTAVMSSVVPRLFWPDKPMAGGRFNMKYYANIQLDKASMNVGPIGEAYGSFGPPGAYVYMFLFGAFISLTIRYFLKLCLRRPLLIFWLPVLFFQTVYCSETDSLQVFNSIFKTAFLLFFIFKLFPGFIRSV